MTYGVWTLWGHARGITALVGMARFAHFVGRLRLRLQLRREAAGERGRVVDDEAYKQESPNTMRQRAVCMLLFHAKRPRPPQGLGRL